MKRLFPLIIMVIITFTAGTASILEATSPGTAKIDESIAVLEQIVNIPEQGIPPALLENAGGIAIIPGVIKAGFILGGRYGSGILVTKDREGEWSNPVFITLTGGSIGWQIGVQSIDIILVFKSNRGIDNIMKGKFTLGADASVAAGPVGRQASAATDIQLKSEIYSYSRSRGLFAGLSLEGAALQIDYDSDMDYYGREAGRPGDILFNKDIKVSPEVQKLNKLLHEYTEKKPEEPAQQSPQQ